MERIVVNVQTGEQTVVPLTPEEIAEAQARQAEWEAQQAAIQQQQADPTEKLRQFLAANPDVVALLNP